MQIDHTRIREHLSNFNFKKLFIEELGWDRHDGSLAVQVEGQTFVLSAVAQKRGVQIFECPPSDGGVIPDYATRKKIDRQVAKSAFEHLVIFTDSAKTQQIWQWVARQSGKPAAYREYPMRTGQSGEIIIQKLRAITFPLDEEEGLTVTGVVFRLRDAFDKDRVTKKFYDLFKKEHDGFLKFIGGLPDEDLERWYTSVMINRLMFIYFIQKKGFLNNDVDYLKNKLKESKQRGKDRFYKEFLSPLFFEGFARKEEERSAKINQLLGKIPYLNGGLFLRHQIEELHGKQIDIPDKAFDKMFAFFDAWEWHLDYNPIRKGNEINPDVLGYIFEKYINQKELGAYYTKEDITGYISKNTIIPYLFDAARKECKIAFEGEHSVWKLLQSDPDRYIYEAVRRGVVLDDGSVLPESKLPHFVQKGMHDPKARMFEKRYNLGEAQLFDEYGKRVTLPTETWREYVERRKRCLELRHKLSSGEIHDINDLITYNLNITQFAQDVIDNCEGPDLLNACRKAINKVTVLDPTCGSGAFLFAALNILEPLYEACLQRMEAFINEWGEEGKKKHPNYYRFFSETLKRVEEHPNTKYFIYKSIIINNLFGVDILEEAVEICKLRLFLKLVAQVEVGQRIEALPDIDFNVRAGNTLVGYATYDEVQKAVTSKLDFDNAIETIEEKAEDVDRLFSLFRQQQTQLGGEVTPEDKRELRKRLRGLEDELNRHLGSEYGIGSKNKTAYEKWVSSHKPFHWFIEFFGIMKSGGFDVIIGNPPYVEYNEVCRLYTVRGYSTEPCANLYAFVYERSICLAQLKGHVGFIIPVSSVNTDGYETLRRLWFESGGLSISSFNDRPGKLFDGIEHCRLSIVLLSKDSGFPKSLLSTRYNKWISEARENLFGTLQFVDSFTQAPSMSIPKIGSSLEGNILLRTVQSQKPMGHFSRRNGRHKLFYTRKLSWFVQILDFIPKIVDEKGGKRQPSELKEVVFSTEEEKNSFLCVLNSNLFYWLLTVWSDCRNLNKREVLNAPFDFNSAKPALKKKLGSLSQSLMEDFQKNAKDLVMNYENWGRMKIQCFYPRFSKPLADEIDCVLAQHYGFTDEELDFVINYDIKYRMGRDAGEEEDG